MHASQAASARSVAGRAPAATKSATSRVRDRDVITTLTAAPTAHRSTGPPSMRMVVVKSRPAKSAGRPLGLGVRRRTRDDGEDAGHQPDAHHDGRLDRGAGGKAVASGAPRQVPRRSTFGAEATSRRTETPRTPAGPGEPWRPLARGMYSDQFKTLSGPSSSMSEETHQAHAARATKSKARSHVIPRRSGSGSRRAVRGGVFAAPRAPFSPPHRNTPATASQTAGIDEAPTWGATWENFPCPPNTSENSGTNVAAESSVPTTAPTTATTASWASTTTPTLRRPAFASCHSA